MKKLWIFIALLWIGTLISSTVNAGDLPEETTVRGEIPVALNYKEVVGTIKYPNKCRHEGVEGTVIVNVLVGKDGSVLDMKVISSPVPELGVIVKESFERLVFRPAYINDQVVERWVSVPVRFRLI